MASVTINAMNHAAAALPAAIPDKPDIEWLYRAHAGDVERWAARLAGPGYDIEDIVQEVFLIVLRSLPRFRHQSKPATWLFGITERVVIHRRRREKFRRWMTAAEDKGANTSSPAPSPLEALEGKQAAELFYRALEGVRERYRTVLVLFELEGMSGQEIANLTSIRVDTIWVWRHRARKQLLKRLAELQGGGR